METKNKIENLFITKMKDFTTEELNVLFTHSFDVIIYTQNKDNLTRYLCVDEDLNFEIDENLTLFYYYKKVKVYYINEIVTRSKNTLKKQFKDLFNI